MFGCPRILIAAIFCGAVLIFAGSAKADFIPGLDRVKFDDGEIYRQGCMTGDSQIRSRACRFGIRNSKKKVVLLGDSHAAQWGPALLRLARKDDWQVIALTRASCPAALISIDRYCNIWRHNSLKRIRRMRPGLVIVASAANFPHYWVLHRGHVLDRQSSERPLVSGMVRTLRKLKRWSTRTVLIRDHSAAPFSVTDCLRRNHSEPENCDFRSTRKKAWSYDFKAARQVEGVQIIDPQPLLCPDRICHAVDGRHLVYRNHGHLAASFVRNQNEWLGQNLDDPWNGKDQAPEVQLIRPIADQDLRKLPGPQNQPGTEPG